MPFVPLIVCLAWIRDNKHDRRYDESEMLLQKSIASLNTDFQTQL